MKKQFLLLALAGSIFVSQPVKAVQEKTIEAVVSGISGIAKVILGTYLCYDVHETFARMEENKLNPSKSAISKTPSKKLRKITRVILFTIFGVGFIAEGIGNLNNI